MPQPCGAKGVLTMENLIRNVHELHKQAGKLNLYMKMFQDQADKKMLERKIEEIKGLVFVIEQAMSST